MTPLHRAFLEFKSNSKEMSPEACIYEWAAFTRKYGDVTLRSLAYDGPVEDFGEKYVLAEMVIDLPDVMHTPKLYELVESALGIEFLAYIVSKRADMKESDT